MNFREHLKASGRFEFNTVPLINVIFLIFVFFMLSSFFTLPVPINVQLPKAVTSDIMKDDNVTIIITSENILYYNDKVITLEELKKLLSRPDHRKCPVLIKADRRASVGRIVDVWDLGRSLGIERINVAADQEQ